MPGIEEIHPAHDTASWRLRHLDFFQHECHLEVRMPQMRLPDSGIRLVGSGGAGKLAVFTLLSEPLTITLCREMLFAAVAQPVKLSWHRATAICERYVDVVLADADFSEVSRLAVDETSRVKGHDHISVFADSDERKVLFIAERCGADSLRDLCQRPARPWRRPASRKSVSIGMSPAFIKGVSEHPPNARIAFDNFHVVARVNTAVNGTRRIEQKIDLSLRGPR